MVKQCVEKHFLPYDQKTLVVLITEDAPLTLFVHLARGVISLLV